MIIDKRWKTMAGRFRKTDVARNDRVENKLAEAVANIIRKYVFWANFNIFEPYLAKILLKVLK